jgi:uncharacterized protein YukE
MSFLPDPAALEGLADRIGGHARATRARAVRLTGAVGGTDWQGLAAEVFHAEAHMLCAGLRAAAGRLDDAADALRRHAGRVGAIVHDLAALGEDGAQTLDDLVHHPGRVPGDVAGLLHAGKNLAEDALSMVGL